MSTWETPFDFPSDGCTWPTLFNDLLGRDRYKKVCRRHDFECRYSVYNWKDARSYFIKGVKEYSPWWLYWRIPIFYIGLGVAHDQCDWTSPTQMPEAWKPYIDRGFGVDD